MFDRRIRLILVEAPDLCLLTKYQIVGIKSVYLQTDVIERLKTEIVFYVDGVCFVTINRSALDKQTIARMLEIAKDLSCLDIT